MQNNLISIKIFCVTQLNSHLITSDTWLLLRPLIITASLGFSVLAGEAISASTAGGTEDVVADCELLSSFCSFLGGGAVSSGGNVNIIGRRFEVSSLTCLTICK